MNVLIVHAHHEPKSFSSALKDRAVATLTKRGHMVEVSDLYAMGFDPVSDRRNFSTVADRVYLKQSREEIHATAHDGFASELVPEMDKILRAELLIFNFPLWWFGMPAILKGWVDRVVAYGKMYGGGKHYEDGFGRGKRALVTITTGSEGTSFNGYGRNPAMSDILKPIHHGIFWFNGFAPLPPFVAYEVAHVSDGERARLLDDYARYLSTLDERDPIVLPNKRDFDEDTSADRFGRWMVEVRDPAAIDEERVADLQRRGKVLAFWVSSEAEAERVAWLVLRAQTRESAATMVFALSRGGVPAFAVRELARPHAAKYTFAH